jgi:hypothetical protein
MIKNTCWWHDTALVYCCVVVVLGTWFSSLCGALGSTRTARYESVKVGRRHGHRLEMPLELLRAWGDMAHVVKGMCERRIGHSSLEREICLVGLNKRNCNHCINAEHGGFHWSLFRIVFM